MFDGPWHGGGVYLRAGAAVDAAQAILDRPILETVWDVVQRRPDSLAMAGIVDRLSYAGLWRLAESIAGRLGEGEGPVGVLLPVGVTYFPALLACLMAGRIAVLMDPVLPVARIDALVAQLAVPVLLVAADGPDLATEARPVTVTAMDPGPAALTAPERGRDLFAPAFILFTSGSTGQPKAVVQHQACALQYAAYQANFYQPGPGAVHLCAFAPSAFTGLIGLNAFALTGGCTRLFDLRREGLSGLADLLRAYPEGYLRISPSVLRLFLQSEDAAALMAGLRSVLLIGEVVLQSDVVALRAILTGGGSILSHYGATECAGFGWVHAPDDAFDPVRGPIGRVAPGTEAMLADEHGRPADDGEPGELVIRSRYSALGEWQKGAVVPGRLLADAADPAYRIYRTGDLTRRVGDVYVVLGRVDRMVKVNGMRVEPAEIEEKARLSGEATGCAVVASGGVGRVTLTAYVVLRSGAVPGDAGRLRTYLRQTLPGPMVPARIVVIELLPLLANGKVDYQALVGTTQAP